LHVTREFDIANKHNGIKFVPSINMAQTSNYFSALAAQTAAVKSDIVNHPSYKAVQSIADLRVFMEHHVFAVWDFMSLLKSLQNHLTCTSVPWFPKGSADVRFLINEIVVGEECDVDNNGKRISHFELYLEAMQQCGANTHTINQFLTHMQSGMSLSEALQKANVPKSAAAFVQFTFDIIQTQKPHIIAAVFTFGREDLIPDMFLSVVRDMKERFPNEVAIFTYYLERHIEVDGGHHSHLSLQMVAELCGNDEQKWQEANTAVMQCLEQRKLLWDGVLEDLKIPATS